MSKLQFDVFSLGAVTVTKGRLDMKPWPTNDLVFVFLFLSIYFC